MAMKRVCDWCSKEIRRSFYLTVERQYAGGFSVDKIGDDWPKDFHTFCLVEWAANTYKAEVEFK